MESYDKVMALEVNDATMALCTGAELKKAGKVLIIQAMLKEGYTVDAHTVYNINIKHGAIQVRARRSAQ